MRTPIPEVILYSWETKPPPLWMEAKPPNIFRDALVQRILDLDNDEITYYEERKRKYEKVDTVREEHSTALCRC
jgi:hypothetical protein